jgi:hypothetical protein
LLTGNYTNYSKVAVGSGCQPVSTAQPIVQPTFDVFQVNRPIPVARIDSRRNISGPRFVGNFRVKPSIRKYGNPPVPNQPTNIRTRQTA